MSWLIVKSTERKAPVIQTDRSGDHLWGDVIDIIPDYFPVDHLIPEPFVAVGVPADKETLRYLLDPLTEQLTPDKSLLRKRYGLVLENLPAQKFSELCAVGKVVVTAQMLDAITESRGG